MNDSGNSEHDIAIIGMVCRFPGADNLEMFWRNLRDGVESIAFFSDQELAAKGVELAALRDPNFIKAGAVIEGVELFDAAFFGYSPREAELMDPQHRIFLECAWAAFESAGYEPTTYPGLIGVYAGMGMSTYLLFNLLSNPEIIDEADSPLVMLGNDKDFLSTRVSYNLNLKGPSLDVQTGCSTSLVAAHLACEGLLSYQCDLALVGGAAVSVPQRTGYYYQEGGIASPDGHCRAFDAQAQGSIFGSGVGVVILKRLADALDDRDHIYAVIKGSAINNDGALKVGFTAPSVAGQAEVIARAQAVAEVAPETISYIEAHGTGTALGDPMELTALNTVFRLSTDAVGFCALGSVKTNIGHLDTAAGVAGLIKTALALQHKQLPPLLHFTQPNQEIDFEHSPFYANTKLIEWMPSELPRRAGVSSFGFGGTNAHLILEEAPPVEESGPSRPWQLLLLSAKTESALDSATDQLIAYLREHPEHRFADSVYSYHVGRAVFDHRRMLVCRDRDDALSALEARDPRRLLTHRQPATERPVAFMFPGLGDQYVSMAYELYQLEDVFREQIDRCAALLKPLLGLDLRDVLYPDRAKGAATPLIAPDGPQQGLDLRAMLNRGQAQTSQAAQKLNQTELAQPVLFVIEYALAQVWLAWGLRPQALIGYSLGEYVAACLSGVFSLEDALFLVAKRAQMIQRLPSGAMLAVPLPEQEVVGLLGPELSLSAINGPSVCVVAGTTDAVVALERQLAARGLACRRLQTAHAFHSTLMEPIAAPFAELVGSITLSPPQIPYVSNVTGTWITAEQATDPGYWVQHLCETVRFADGLRAVWADSEQVLIEVGPGQVLSGLAMEYVEGDGGADRLALPSLRSAYDRRQPDLALLLNTLGHLWLAGVPVSWSGFYARERRNRVPTPTYPFERQRYWIAPQAPAHHSGAQRSSLAKRSDIADWFYIPSWKRTALPKPPSTATQKPRRWLVFVDEYGLGAGLMRQLERAGQQVVVVRAGQAYSRIDADLYTVDPRSRDSYDELIADLHAANTLPDAIIHLWSITAGAHSLAGALSFRAAQEIGFYSLLFIAQALAESGYSTPIQLYVISNGVQEVESADVCFPEKATLLGPCKVIPQEYDTITCRSIDIAVFEPERIGEDALISQLVAEMTDKKDDPVVAYRGGRRWVQTFEPLALASDSEPVRSLRERGVYLITGGLGGIGLLLAGYLAEKVRARLILTGRSVFPARDAWDAWLETHGDEDEVSRKLRSLLTLEACGAEVMIASADVADEEQMRAVVTQAYARFGTIHGVIHAAGIAGMQAFQLIPAADYEACEAQFRPKVYGTYVLQALFQAHELDFCLLFSSNTAILGGLGSTAYTAANLFLDALAQRQRGASTQWISANWDGWLLQENGNLNAYQTSIDTYAMFPKESLECFWRIASHTTDQQVIVSTGDLTSRLNIWITRTAAGAQASSAAHHPRPILKTSYIPPEDEVQQTVAVIWQELLGIEQIGIHDNFFDLGGHSLLGLKIMARLKGELNVDIPVVSLFEGPTISALAKLIGQNQQAAPAYEESRSQGAGRKQRIREKHQRNRSAVQEQGHD